MRMRVRVSPAWCHTKVGGRDGSTEPPILLVRVRAPAVAGKANDAVMAAVALAFGVTRSEVGVVSGHSGRHKVLEVAGADPATLHALLTP
jgi:uncharacterized protein YggU (UPF0235/DUF167 family)